MRASQVVRDAIRWWEVQIFKRVVRVVPTLLF